MVALKVGKKCIKYLASEGLRCFEAHTIALLLSNCLCTISTLFCSVLSINQNDLTKDLLEEEFEEVGNGASESGIFRLLLLLDLLAPAQPDGVRTPSVSVLEHAQDI